MKERWIYFKTKMTLKWLKIMVKPCRWAILHISPENRIKSINTMLHVYERCNDIESCFPEARIIKIDYLLIALAGTLDGCHKLGIEIPDTLTHFQNN